jgi:transposase-like protein
VVLPGAELPPINEAGSEVKISTGERRGHGTKTIYGGRDHRAVATIEIELGEGLAVVEACRKLGIMEQTYYRWKKEYGGLRVDQAKRLKGLEQEHVRLKRLVADLSLDKSILKEVAADALDVDHLPIRCALWLLWRESEPSILGGKI